MLGSGFHTVFPGKSWWRKWKKYRYTSELPGQALKLLILGHPYDLVNKNRRVREPRKLPQGSRCSEAGVVNRHLEASSRNSYDLFVVVKGFRHMPASGKPLAVLARTNAIAHQLGFHPSTRLPLLLPCPIHPPTATSKSMSPPPTHRLTNP